MKYLYSFCAWPNETWGVGREPRHSIQWPREVFHLFRCGLMRKEMEFTEEEFTRFRAVLDGVGITLREIERIPSVTPESVL